jgi:type I restriction enzyme S subunit
VKVVPLRHAAEILLGRQRAPEYEHGEGQTRYLRSANVQDGRLDLSDVKLMRFSQLERARFGLEPGDVLVTEGSGSRDTVGASAVWLGQLNEAICFQNTLLRLRPRADVSGRYLAWWARYAQASDLRKYVSDHR